MVDGGLSFKDLEALHAVMLSEKSWPCRAPADRDLHQSVKAAGFGERYGGFQKKLEAYAKELDKLIGPSPDKQDAVASTCFVLDSLSALEK